MSAEAEQNAGAAAEANVDPREPAAVTPERGDPKPRSRGRGGKRAGAGRPKGSKAKSPAEKKPSSAKRPSDTALEQALAEILVLPVVPSVLFAPSLEGKEFLASHFIGQAPVAASQLVELSKQSPELREVLEKMTTASVTMGLVSLALGYAAPPVLWMIGQRGMAQGLTAMASMNPAQLASAQLAAREAAAEPEATLEPDYAQAPPAQGATIYDDPAQAANAALQAQAAARAAAQQL